MSSQSVALKGPARSTNRLFGVSAGSFRRDESADCGGGGQGEACVWRFDRRVECVDLQGHVHRSPPTVVGVPSVSQIPSSSGRTSLVGRVSEDA